MWGTALRGTTGRVAAAEDDDDEDGVMADDEAVSSSVDVICEVNDAAGEVLRSTWRCGDRTPCELLPPCPGGDRGDFGLPPLAARAAAKGIE